MIAAFIDGLFRYQFLQNALLTSIIVGLISGVIGSFIILRGMSLMGDAISHAVCCFLYVWFQLYFWRFYFWLISCIIDRLYYPKKSTKK